jgi:hypothetical protein
VNARPRFKGLKHPAVLTTTQAMSNPPLFTPDTYQFTASMGSISLLGPYLDVSCWKTVRPRYYDARSQRDRLQRLPHRVRMCVIGLGHHDFAISH